MYRGASGGQSKDYFSINSYVIFRDITYWRHSIRSVLVFATTIELYHWRRQPMEHFCIEDLSSSCFITFNSKLFITSVNSEHLFYIYYFYGEENFKLHFVLNLKSLKNNKKRMAKINYKTLFVFSSFWRPWHMAPGDNCPPLPPLSYATAYFRK